MKRIRTQHYKEVLLPDYATETYDILQQTIIWKEGVRSVKGFTRYAHATSYGCIPQIDEIIDKVKLELELDFDPNHVYINYYADGTHYTPSHSHPGSRQVVISLGATRTLTVGAKNYPLGNGDVIIFGSSSHGVNPDPSCLGGRISIAMFIAK